MVSGLKVEGLNILASQGGSVFGYRMTVSPNLVNLAYSQSNLHLGAKDAGAVIDGIVRDVDAFAGGVEQADDITLLAFKLISPKRNYDIIRPGISLTEGTPC